MMEKTILTVLLAFTPFVAATLQGSRLPEPPGNDGRPASIEQRSAHRAGSGADPKECPPPERAFA